MEQTNKELAAFWVSLSLTLRGQHIPLHGTKIFLCDFSWAANTRLRQRGVRSGNLAGQNDQTNDSELLTV